MQKIDVPYPEPASESPLKQFFDVFDVEHTDWSEKDYQDYALGTKPDFLNEKLIQEILWRRDHGMNFVASMEGHQGLGKSMPFFYFCQLIGKIFGKPFNAENVYYAPEELEEALSNAEPRETFLRDEYRRMRGIMSKMIEENLSDYEDQFRETQNNILMCSVKLINRSHFFCFEAKKTEWKEVIDEDGEKKGYPFKFISVLKTPRYTNSREFVWRGYVSFPMPEPEFVAEYKERKQRNIENLKKKYGNTLNPVNYYAEVIFVKRELDLIKQSKEGFVNPIRSELMDLIIAEEIGTMKFTIKGYEIVRAKIRDSIEKKYTEHNQKVFEKEKERKANKEQIVKDQVEEDQQKAEAKRERREKIRLMELEAEKRKFELKERALEIKRKELELKEAKRKSNVEGELK